MTRSKALDLLSAVNGKSNCRSSLVNERLKRFVKTYLKQKIIKFKRVNFSLYNILYPVNTV